jgi:cold shock protein
MSTETKVYLGTVKFFLEAKGYGFVTDEVSKTDYFFHFSEVKEKGLLQKGEKVSFELEEGNRGLKAINIQRIL